MSRLIAFALVTTLCLSGCSEAPEPQPAPAAPAAGESSAPPAESAGDNSTDTAAASIDDEARAAVDEYTATFFAQQPALATSMGVSEEAFGDYNRRLPDHSPEGMQTLRRDMRGAAERLAELQDPALPDDLNRHLAINETIARYYAGDEGFEAGYVDTWGGHLPYVLNQISGPLIDLPNILQDQHEVLDAEDADNYLARLDAFARVADDVRAKLLADAEGGVILPKPLFPNTRKMLDNFVAPTAGEHPLVASFSDKLADADAIDAEQAEQYVARATATLEDEIYPRFRQVGEALQSLYDRAPERGGIWAQPNGEAYYEHAITFLGDSELSAEEIHQLGLREVERITAEMDIILTANGYTDGSVGERLQQLNAEPRFLYEDSDEGRAELLEFLRGEIEVIDERAPDWFATLPPQDVEVRRIPEAIEAGSSGGYYVPPSLDGERPGVFFINLKDMNAVPQFAMKTLTYHEAVPGHHFQIALNMQQTDIGLMRQNAPFNGYVEGWALYSELVAADMGMYEDDPFGDLGRLQAEVYRAARLVVDTGLHHKRWTRQEAIDYFAEATGTAMSDVVPAIDRYIAWPGQALGYKLGMVTLVELREKAREAMGEDFDIKAFHDLVLLPGARPMRMVREDIEGWIASTFDGADVQDAGDRIAVVEGLSGPEAVHWDAEQQVWFIANFNGQASGDANGFITKVASDGEILAREFMTGTDEHPLHGPRGMRIDGDRLWVADADGLHAFDRRTGEPMDFIDFTAFEPGFLNDVELGPDGALYLTDTGNARLFRIVDGEISIVAGDELVSPPNGIAWNPVSESLVLAPWGGGLMLMDYNTGAGALSDGPTLPYGGNMDGLEPWQGGLLVASQVDHAIWFVQEGNAEVVIRTEGRPADIGLDAANGRIAVPYIALDRVDLWALPQRP